MNNQYISFLQNTFTDALNPDKQAENINNILTHTFSQFEEISSSLNNLSNNRETVTPEDFFKYFNFSSDNYKKSFNDYMKLFGLVSIEEYRALIKKYEKLKKEKQTTESDGLTHKNKVATLNKTIKSQKDEIATQAKTITAQTKTITTQTNSLTKTKKETADFKAKLATQQKTITSLEKKIASVPTKKGTAAKASKK